MDLNYTQDFKFRASFVDSSGKNVALAPVDFCIVLSVDNNTVYCRNVSASRSGNILSGCQLSKDAMALFVPVKGRQLYPGLLTARLYLYVPDSVFPDGVRTVRSMAVCDARLVNGSDLIAPPLYVDAVFELPDFVTNISPLPDTATAGAFVNVSSVDPGINSIEDVCSSELIAVQMLDPGTIVTFRSLAGGWEMWQLVSDVDKTDPASWKQTDLSVIADSLKNVPTESYGVDEVQGWIRELQV